MTPKQHDVVALMAKGQTNFEIAQALGFSLDGAKYHVSEILARLDVSSREEAVAGRANPIGLPVPAALADTGDTWALSAIPGVGVTSVAAATPPGVSVAE